jgi:hypothetical protein
MSRVKEILYNATCCTKCNIKCSKVKSAVDPEFVHVDFCPRVDKKKK